MVCRILWGLNATAPYNTVANPHARSWEFEFLGFSPPARISPPVVRRFKTKAGRDLAVGRSGEGLGASGPWSPASVSVVRGRNEDAAEDKSLSDFLMVLPQGRSVAEVLETVGFFSRLLGRS